MKLYLTYVVCLLSFSAYGIEWSPWDNNLSVRRIWVGEHVAYEWDDKYVWEENGRFRGVDRNSDRRSPIRVAEDLHPRTAAALFKQYKKDFDEAEATRRALLVERDKREQEREVIAREQVEIQARRNEHFEIRAVENADARIIITFFYCAVMAGIIWKVVRIYGGRELS